MTSIELSETAEILLKRIVESRFGPGSGSYMLLNDSIIEHLIHEEARRLNLLDNECEEEEQ